MNTPRIAICKIYMFGDKVLILGICRNMDGEEYWFKKQLFTLELMTNLNEDAPFVKLVRKKYQGSVVHFDSINLDVTVYEDQHEFNLGKATQYEITKEELKLLEKELLEDYWMEFDLETWGK